jgi:uncharacterized protein (TIGR02302 family)
LHAIRCQHGWSDPEQEAALTHSPDHLRHLRRPVSLTRIGMIAEQAARAFWPLWVVVGLTLGAVLMGWHDVVPAWLVVTGLGASALCMVVALVWGALRFRLPSRDAALARVDAQLAGRPLAALRDAQAIGRDDPVSQAIWQAHLARMAKASQSARAVRPDFDLAVRDPFGLRLLAALCLVTALLFGSLGRFGTISDLGLGDDLAVVSGPAWEGWVTPPAYTGKPTLYLNDQPAGDLAVPVGSVVTLRIYGPQAALGVVQDVSATAPVIGDDGQPSAFDIHQSGQVEIQGAGIAWAVTALPDQVPFVELIAPISADAMGELTQAFRAADDYGIETGTATIALDLAAVDRAYGLARAPDPIADLVLDLPLPFTGDRSDFDAFLIENLSTHPLANLPVTLQLQVRDAAGQVAQTLPEPLILPGRRFFQPFARAVTEQRRDLLWSRANARRVGQVLRAISHEPAGILPDQANYLRLRAIIRRLDDLPVTGLDATVQTELAAAMWDLAVQLEDGRLADARERLRRAQERLSEAMRNGASDAEIAELMRELRAATDDYLRMLAEQATPSDGTDQADSGGQMQQLAPDDLQAMMDRIEELMQQGRMAEAQALMDQLAQMMENLRVTQSEGQGQGQGQQSMQDLTDTLRDQQDLADDAFGELQRGQQGQGDAGDLASRQQDLRRELDRQRGNLPDPDGQAGDALERAESAMEGAEDALRDGDLSGAIDQQAAALDALRDGMRALEDAMAQDGSAPDATGDGTAAQGRDPLGREQGGTNQAATGGDMVGAPDENRRGGELMDEIRRRSADRDRDPAERDYLQRLLDPF